MSRHLPVRVTSHRNEILVLADRYGAKDIRIFGSVARGQDTADSDIDVLVSMESGRTLLDLVGFWQDLEELLECHVDVVSERGINPYLRDKILTEAVHL